MNNKYLSCNGLGYNPAMMVSGFLRSFFKTMDWYQFKDREVIYTYQARNAISLLCEILDIGSGDEVLVPAYNCGAEIDPFINAGAKAILYRIDDRGRIDIEDIKKRVSRSTRLVHVTHFFGWPQDIEGLVKWCENRGIFLIEDCAQALFSEGSNRLIGKTGDAAVYSFVKSLPVPDGGALVFNRKCEYAYKKFRNPRLRVTLRNSLPLLKKGFMNKNMLWQRFDLTRNLLTKSWLRNTSSHDRTSRPEMLSSNYLDKQKNGWSMSRISKGVLSAANAHAVIETRRRNYMYLENDLSDIQSFKPLFEMLPDGVCPMSFPFLVDDRSRWYQGLDERGVLVQGWPGYYPGFNWDGFPEACNLKDNLLTLPVHQFLEMRHMAHIAESVKAVAGGE